MALVKEDNVDDITDVIDGDSGIKDNEGMEVEVIDSDVGRCPIETANDCTSVAGSGIKSREEDVCVHKVGESEDDGVEDGRVEDGGVENGGVVEGGVEEDADEGSIFEDDVDEGLAPSFSFIDKRKPFGKAGRQMVICILSFIAVAL